MKRFGMAGAFIGVVLGAAGILLYPAAEAQSPSGTTPATVATPQPQAQEHQKWLIAALTKVEAFQTGMTRGAVLAVFMPEPDQITRIGTPGSVARQVYALRECPLIKVEFEFLPDKFKDPKYWDLWDRHSMWKGRTEQADDVIVRVSKPYLAR